MKTLLCLYRSFESAVKELKIGKKNGPFHIKGTASTVIGVVLSACLLSGSVHGSEAGKIRKDPASADVDRRVKAATALAQSHDIQGVRAALKDSDARVRHAAIHHLSILPTKGWEKRDPEAAAVFIESLRDRDPGVRYAALYALRGYDSEAFFSRHDMDPDVCASITPLLADAAENVRYQAVMSVEHCRITEIEEGLLRLAADRKEPMNIRQTAIMKLARSRTEGMDIKIMKYLSREEAWQIQYAAIYCLGNLKSSRAVDAIIPYVYDKDRKMRDAAIIALGSIGDPRAAAALSDVLVGSGNRIAEYVLSSLAKAGSPAALPRLLKVKHLLRDAHEKARYIEALGATGSEDAVEPLLEFFDDKDDSLKFQASKALDRYDSPAALNRIIEHAKKRPEDRQLNSLAAKARRRLDFPDEAVMEKQKQQEEKFVQQQEYEIGRIYYQGMKLAGGKKYEKALPLLYEAADKFEKLYALYPGHFKSSSNKLMPIRGTLAGYYRWKVGDTGKAVAEYERLIAALEKFWPDSGALTLNLLILGEIYEKDIKDYEKAATCYAAALKPFRDPDRMKDEKQYLSGWYLTWINFLVDRVNVLELKRQPAFTKRLFKFPNFEYRIFLSFGAFMGPVPEEFFDENVFDNQEGAVSPDVFARLHDRYPGSFRTMLFGLTLFHQFLKDDKIDHALATADRLVQYYPDDLHTVMLLLETAELYQKQNNEKKYREYRSRALQTAKTFNVELVMGPDPRFATPEKTWALFVKSLREGDVDAAVECFSPHSRDRQRELFTVLRDKLPVIASDMRTISKAREEPASAEYSITRAVDGQEISFGVYFVNIFGEWMIERL